MEQLTIRPMSDEDVLSVVELNEAARADGYSDTGFIVLPLTATQVSREACAPDVHYAVCEAHHGQVAFLKYSTRSLSGYENDHWCPRRINVEDGVHIEKIVVRRDVRGSGIGRSLYRWLFESVRAPLFYSFVVVSPTPNVASICFHEALGFTRRADVPYALPNGTWFYETLFVLTPGAELVAPDPDRA